MLSRLSMSFLLVSNYFPSSSCDVGGSSRISTCLQIPEWLTWTGQDFCSLYLFPPFLSFFLWWLFLFLCPQEASTDQVLGPSAFPGSHSSRMGRETWKSNHPVGHPLDDSNWLIQALGQCCVIHWWIIGLFKTLHFYIITAYTVFRHYLTAWDLHLEKSLSAEIWRSLTRCVFLTANIKYEVRYLC